ncbi:hypothetical protein AX14_006950 [Amanita brunnescens Koide BX004]|nr:hypothetical protein AX14_006950 [Amanita brunnescens Koide BX004]
MRSRQLTRSMIKEEWSSISSPTVVASPACSDNYLGYKFFSWSSCGYLLALLNSASFYANGGKTVIDGKNAFVAYPNRDPTPFRQFYNILEAETVVRGMLIYLGFHEFIKGLVDLYWLDSSLTLADVMKKRLVLGILERNLQVPQ